MTPIKLQLARFVKRTAHNLGWEIRRSTSSIGELEPFLARLQRLGFRPQRILDVGAHQADWAQTTQSFFPEATFVLVEPQADLAPRLKAFCDRSPGSRFVQAAAGREPGELLLNIWKDHTAGSSLLPLVDVSGAVEQRRVPIVTIDSLYPDDGQLPEFVKLDVQGFELEALQGGTRLFGQTQLFLMETSLYASGQDRPLVDDVIAFMGARSYKIFDVPGFYRRPLDGALGEIDLAFVLKGGVLDLSES
jgi:FkbM family methyltransferase